MQKNMTDRTPGSYDDFVAYLGTVRTEEELFSRLTYWFAGQDRPEDVLSRSELVEARAKELGFWQGLTFRMERWLADGKSELEAVGREEFQSRIAEDYAAYREKADAARARFRDRRRAAPFNFTPDCLENVPIQNVSWLVDGLLPMGEVSLLGADGGTGKGIWQAQLIAYVTAGRTSGFFPQPPEKTGSVLIFSGEDDPGKVLKARLTAAGADMSRVMVVTSDAYFARTGSPLCIPDTSFAKYVGKAAPALVIIDPLQSFLPAGVEMASRNQMRSALLPLKARLRGPHLDAHQQARQRLGPRPSGRQLRHLGHRPQRPHDGPRQEQRKALPQPREEQLLRPGPDSPAPHRAGAGGGRHDGGGRL